MHTGPLWIGLDLVLPTPKVKVKIPYEYELILCPTMRLMSKLLPYPVKHLWVSLMFMVRRMCVPCVPLLFDILSVGDSLRIYACAW